MCKLAGLAVLYFVLVISTDLAVARKGLLDLLKNDLNDVDPTPAGDATKTGDCVGSNCPPEGKLKKVVMKQYCGGAYTIDATTAAVSLVPTAFPWTPITPCTNCSVTMVTAGRHRLLATFYSLGLEEGAGGACSEDRLDFYDGNDTLENKRLSGAGGVCGSALPPATYVSSGSSLTVRLSTSCPPGRPAALGRWGYGMFELVVATLKSEDTCPGQFQCGSGQCLNKTLVCNGQADCPDDSDETACPSVEPVFPKWAIVVLTLICASMIILAAYVIYLMCTVFCACTSRSYEKI